MLGPLDLTALLLMGMGVLALDDPASAQPGDEVPEGHSHISEAFNEGPRQSAYLMGTTGEIEFPVTTASPEAQAFFEQGVGQLHGFWYFEAERSFRQAAAIDPDCPMAYWGMAMANFQGNRERAKGFIAEARERAENVELPRREQLYIDGLANYLEKVGEDRKKAAEAYFNSLEEIIYLDPSDLEAKAFLAVRLWQMGRDVPINSRAAVDALMTEVFAANPEHPAHHYRIHLWDGRAPQRALESAGRCGQSAPGIAHMWHMPNHIYSGLKRYVDAVWQQEASSRVDHAHMIRDRVMPDQIHNYAHNQEWMIRNMNAIGRMETAATIAENLVANPRHPKYNRPGQRGRSAAYGRSRWIQTLLEFEMWDELPLACQCLAAEPGESSSDRLTRLRALGAAHYGLGDRERLAQLVSDLETNLSQIEDEQNQAKAESEAKPDPDANPDPDAKAEEEKRKADSRRRKAEKSRIEDALRELRGCLALLDGDSSAAAEQFAKLRSVSRTRRATLLSQAGQIEEALKQADRAVSSGTNQVLPLAIQAAILHQDGQTDRARTAFEKLRSLSSQIESLEVPPLARLAPLAQELDLPQDWRIAYEPAEDVGQRPDLDDLGPLLWRPSPAPDWSLSAADGSTASLSKFQGKPVLLIFYLGFGCLHCVEQLETFGPRADEFEALGLEIVAIGTDTLEDMRAQVFNYGSEVPFRFAADPEMNAFRAYRAYDDFEDQPLHGTFLIDAQGRIRWSDVSFEPFTDVDFLLGESRRLLELPLPTDVTAPVVTTAIGEED